MSEILLVDDNPEMGELVSQVLKSVARVEVVPDRPHAIEKINSKNFDLYILDLHLPDCHGYEIFQMVQDRGVDPKRIVFLSADSTDAAQITGFNLGAEDYILKPFAPGPFRARIASKLQSFSRREFVPSLVEGPLRIDPLGMRILLQKEDQSTDTLDLTPIEYKILLSLIKNKSRVVTRQNLIDEAWGKNVFVGDRVVDQHVASLRKKLGSFQSCIHTVYGSGYRFLN